MFVLMEKPTKDKICNLLRNNAILKHHLNITNSYNKVVNEKLKELNRIKNCLNNKRA